MTLQHRSYRSSDRDTCIAVFHSNVPLYFRDHELDEFTDFIDSGECEYFVVPVDGDVIACGGFGLREGSDTADLCWGMVHRGQQGKGIGEYLLLCRLYAIVATTEAKHVRLGTSQHTEGFFRRHSFEIQSSKRDGIASGLDDVEMKFTLTKANCESIERDWRKVSGCSSDQSEC